MQAVILAAGNSSRFWPINEKHKCLFKIMGKPLIFYLIDQLKENGIKDLIIIQSNKREIEKELEEYELKGITYLVQSKPISTGDAILQAKKLIKDSFIVVNAERIDIGDHIEMLLKKTEKSEMVLLAGPTKTPWIFGILELDEDRIINLVEKPDKGSESSNLKLVGTYIFPKEFLSYLEKVPVHPYSLEKAILLYAKEKEAKVAIFPEETFSLKFPWDLFPIKKYLFDRYLKSRNIHKTVKISKNVIINNNVVVGENTKILENTVINGPCYIGSNCIIGNSVLIRDYTDIEDNVLIGANAEITRSIFEDSVSVHQGFFGDSVLDKNVWVGAGVITANKRFDKKEIKTRVIDQDVITGLKSFGVIIGQRSKIGVNSSFMPGVLVGKDSTILPGSLVNKNI